LVAQLAEDGAAIGSGPAFAAGPPHYNEGAFRNSKKSFNDQLAVRLQKMEIGCTRKAL
jgi:hypothetical protein